MRDLPDNGSSAMRVLAVGHDTRPGERTWWRFRVLHQKCDGSDSFSIATSPGGSDSSSLKIFGGDKEVSGI